MQMNSATNTRKRNDRYVANRKDSKKRKQFVLEPGMTGFLCTCNFHERGCITEAYRLLNLFADEKSEIHKVFNYVKQNILNICKYLLLIIMNIFLFFHFKKSTNALHKKETDKSIEDIDDDISIVLEKEINELRTEHKMSLSSRKFQVHLSY